MNNGLYYFGKCYFSGSLWFYNVKAFRRISAKSSYSRRNCGIWLSILFTLPRFTWSSIRFLLCHLERCRHHFNRMYWRFSFQRAAWKKEDIRYRIHYDGYGAIEYVLRKGII